MTTLTVPRTTPASPIDRAERDLYTAEASDLGIRPGQRYPDTIHVSDGMADAHPVTFHRVNVPRHYPEDTNAGALLLGRYTDADGDLMCQDYRTRSGDRFLRVFND